MLILLSSEGGLMSSDGFSVTVGFLTGISVEADDVHTSKSTQPKDPSKFSGREEVSVPARAIFVLPNPLHQRFGQPFLPNEKLILVNLNPKK